LAVAGVDSRDSGNDIRRCNAQCHTYRHSLREAYPVIGRNWETCGQGFKICFFNQGVFMKAVIYLILAIFSLWFGSYLVHLYSETWLVFPIVITETFAFIGSSICFCNELEKS